MTEAIQRLPGGWAEWERPQRGPRKLWAVMKYVRYSECGDTYVEDVLNLYTSIFAIYCLVLGSHVENHGCSGKSTGSGGHTDMNSSPDPSLPSCVTLGK